MYVYPGGEKEDERRRRRGGNIFSLSLGLFGFPISRFSTISTRKWHINNSNICYISLRFYALNFIPDKNNVTHIITRRRRTKHNRIFQLLGPLKHPFWHFYPLAIHNSTYRQKRPRTIFPFRSSLIPQKCSNSLV